MAKRIQILAFIFSVWNICHAQDVHFSQYFNSPLLINPALTGNFKGTGRFIFNYKNQWSSLTSNPYKTMAFSYDRPIIKNNFFVGINILDDRAGDSEMSLTQIGLNIASKVKIQANDFLKLGIQIAWSYRSINFDNLTWNSQFNGSSIDPNLNSGEINFQESFNYIDFSTGMLWTHVIKENKQFTLGTSAFHISKPAFDSFITYDEVHIRWTVHGDLSIPVLRENLILDPSFQVMFQGPFREINFGISTKYIYGLDTRLIGNPSYISFGIFYRYRDAIIINTRFNFKSQFDVDLSYDINISKLRTASRINGGIELSLIYTIPEKRIQKLKYK